MRKEYCAFALYSCPCRFFNTRNLYTFLPFVIQFGSSCNMTKRDSVAAGFTFPPMSMNFPRCHHHSVPHDGHSSDWQPSGAAGTSYTSHPEYPTWSTSHTPADVDQSHSSEITALPPPIPTSSQSGNQTPIIPSQEVSLPDWHPLQHQITESRRQVHAHYFIEVSTPGNDSNLPADRYLMVTEVDQHGIHRNRQPEYFFNGIVGHIRACRNGWIDSWTQSNQLANYWRRHFDIPEIRQNRSSTWWNYDDPESQTSGHNPNMEDTDSVTAQVDNPPPVRSTNWLLSFGTFSTVTGRQIKPSWNDWRTRMKISNGIQSRSSRLGTWLTLPAIWQKPLVHWRTRPSKWRPCRT